MTFQCQTFLLGMLPEDHLRHGGLFVMNAPPSKAGMQELRQNFVFPLHRSCLNSIWKGPRKRTDRSSMIRVKQKVRCQNYLDCPGTVDSLTVMIRRCEWSRQVMIEVGKVKATRAGQFHSIPCEASYLPFLLPSAPSPASLLPDEWSRQVMIEVGKVKATMAGQFHSIPCEASYQPPAPLCSLPCFPAP